MKKNIMVQSIALTLASSFSLIGSANENQDNPKNENVIVVTANRVEQDINDTLAAIEVITRDDIERIQPESITDLLTTVAGLDFTFNGGAGQNSSLFTRGTNSDHTLIVVDGIRVGSATSGTKSFSTIPVAQIERIEIVKGPRATLWGSDAIGGVIQIFTRRLKNQELSVHLGVGSNKHTSTDISVGFGNDELSNTLTVSYENSHGYDIQLGGEPDNDGYRRLSASLRGEYRLGDSDKLDWVAQLAEGNNEFDNFFGNRNQTDYDNYLANLRYSYTGDSWSTQLSINESKDEGRTYADINNKKEGSLFATKRTQYNLLTQYKVIDTFSFSGGIEHFNDDVSDSENIETDITLDYSNIKQSTQSGFITAILNSDTVIADISIRHDDIDDVGSNDSFNVSAGFHFLDNFTLSASRSEGFKAPTFNELYYPITAYFVGNSDLLPERSFNNEILLKAQWSRFNFLLAGFENKISNLISYQFPTSVNIDKVKIKGGEVTFSHSGEFLSHKLGISYIEAKDATTNIQLSRRAREKVNYEINTSFDIFSLFAQVNYSGERSDGSVNLKSFTQINLGATYFVNDSWKINLKVNDATDKAPITVSDYPSAGRQFFISAQYTNF